MSCGKTYWQKKHPTHSRTSMCLRKFENDDKFQSREMQPNLTIPTYKSSLNKPVNCSWNKIMSHPFHLDPANLGDVDRIWLCDDGRVRINTNDLTKTKTLWWKLEIMSLNGELLLQEKSPGSLYYNDMS